MDRIGVGARVLKRLPHIHSVLDVGCRDAKLADLLPEHIEYFGADLQQTSPRVKYVGDFANVEFNRTFSAVVALDILEHTEALSANFDKLASLAERYLIVSLPNCADLLTRVRFVRTGRLGGKYEFDGTDPLDRHRWVMNFREIQRFFRQKAVAHGLELETIDLTYGSSGRSTGVSWAGRVVSRLLPESLTAGTVVAVFSKSPVATLVPATELQRAHSEGIRR